MGAARDRRRAQPMPRPRPMASRSALNLRRAIRRFWCWTANSRPSQSTRCFSSRNAASPGTTPAARTSSSCSACSRRTRPRKPSRILLGEARAPSSRRASTLSSPISAADSADATIRRSRSTSRWRRCSSRVVRSGSRTTAISSSRGGIKRHAFKMHTRIGVDRASGKIVAFAADHVLDGGGLANFSGTVAKVGAAAAIGIYDIPKVDVTTVALHSRGVTAGSMRGYGTLQTMTALETLVDEMCAALPLDPIEFRRRNALKTGGRTMTGNHVQRVGPHAGDPGQAREASDLAAARRGEGARAAERGFSSAPASLAPPRITAPARTARSGRWKSTRMAGSPSIATASRWATASGRRWPIGSRPIWAAWPTKSRSRRWTRSARSRS